MKKQIVGISGVMLVTIMSAYSRDGSATSPAAPTNAPVIVTNPISTTTPCNTMKPMTFAVNELLQAQKEVFLRIGLSREFTSPDSRAGYWLQANGIYTFPHYHEGIRSYSH